MRRLARLPSFPAADGADAPARTDEPLEATQAHPADGAVVAQAGSAAARPCASTGNQAVQRKTVSPASPPAEGVPATAEPAGDGVTESPGPDHHRTEPNPDAEAQHDTTASIPASALPDRVLPEPASGATPGGDQGGDHGGDHGAAVDGDEIAVGGRSTALPVNLDGLAIAIDGFADRMEAYRTSIGEAAAQAFGDAARRCLPRMADAAAAAEIAQSARALAASCQGGTIELRVPPALVRPLAEALDRRMPAMTCVIAGDPGLAPDRAEIAWRGERCWPDPEQLAGAATAILGDAIARQTAKGETG